MSRPHPLGLTSHPEWEAVERRRDRLIMAERARRYPSAKPALRPSLVTAVAGAIAGAVGMIGLLVR